MQSYSNFLFSMLVRPDPPCPTVDACSSTCGDCRLNVTSSGDLSCYVQGSRPRIDIDWIVTNQSGISFTNNEQVIRYHEETGTYNTTRTICYKADDCGGMASLYCNAYLSESSSRVPFLTPTIRQFESFQVFLQLL